MTPNPTDDSTLDSLDRLAENLRALRPRPPGAAARRRVAARLDAPPALARRAAGPALRLSAAAALAVVSGAVAWTFSRPEIPSDRRPAAASEHASAQAGTGTGSGCECRVRFQPRPPVRAADARPIDPDRRA